MKKRILIIAGLCLALCCGCTSTSPAPANESTVSDADSSSQSDNENTDAVDESADADTESPADAETESSDTAEEHAEPETVHLSMDEPCGTAKFQITCAGLKQYEALEGDTYTDTPEDGNVYLVLFLNVTNYDQSDLYFSAESFTATVDGADLSHTFLINDPEGYSSIFNTIPAGSTANGFIVWQVPSDWKELSLHYTAWSDVLNTIIDGTFTPDDLSDPTPFDQL